MLKSKKGVTLTILVITIIIMLIIFGVTVSTADDLLRNSQKNRLKTNLYLIQAKASSLLEDYLFDTTIDFSSYDNYKNDKANIEKYLGGTLVTDISKVKTVGFEKDSTSFSSTYIYCVWSISDVEAQGISTENIAANDTFIIQYNIEKDEVDVGSTNGCTDKNGTVYHILSEF
jgi:Tfp pilus assembly protein PilE